MGVYKWSEGSRFIGDVQEIGDWLENIDDRTTDRIVRLAENPKCPAHHCFTWEDDKAAHRWRMQEARMLVNAIVVVREDDNGQTLEIPAYESVIVADKRQYVSTTVASLTEDEVWSQISGEAKAAIKSLRRKLTAYQHLRKASIEQAQGHLELAAEALGA